MINITLEKDCVMCNGTGKDKIDYSKDIDIVPVCKYCKGKGQIPTQIGKEILTFIAKHLDITHPDYTQEV